MGFVSALLMMAQPMRAFGALNNRVQEGLASAERYYEVLSEAPVIVSAPDAKPIANVKGAIEFEGVCFSYANGERDAVRNFSLSVKPNTTVALVGRSGAGKSTIFNLVPRLYDPQRGTIRIDGQDIRAVTVESLRDSMALVSQDISLFDDTVEANIALGRLNATKEDIEAAAKAAAAHEFVEKLPEGYQTMIGDRGVRLSGGQRQRVALARAILRNAPILLFDEATSALDAESERLVQQALAAFSQSRTTLVIAHRLATVKNADDLRDGGWRDRGNRHPRPIPGAGRDLRPALQVAGAAAGRTRLLRDGGQGAGPRVGGDLLALQRAVDEEVRPALRAEGALDLSRIVAPFEPFEERHRFGIVIGHVALEEVVEHAGFGLADVPEFEAQLLHRLLDRLPLLHVHEKGAHQAARSAPDLQ